MSIDIDADFFLTAPLNGCAVVIGGTRTHPIVIHVNYASDRLDPPHLDRMTREQLERAYREHQVGVYGVFYRALAVELCRRGHLGGHVRALFEPNDYLTRGGGQARVFGIKRGNRWSFYASIDLEGRRPSNTRCATELIW